MCTYRLEGSACERMGIRVAKNWRFGRRERVAPREKGCPRIDGSYCPGAAIVVIDMPLLDTRRAVNNVMSELIADIVLRLFSYVAHVERENTRQRQAEGIATARARGVHLGRPRKERPAQYTAVRREFERGGLTRRPAAERLGVCPGTFGRWRREDAMKCASDV